LLGSNLIPEIVSNEKTNKTSYDCVQKIIDLGKNLQE